ncbi:hypothetical protein [Leptolyngbya sp. NIES-2104]|uniref:hypothetical protein n=1 Tax=Leptolyngbya sp. NIES-2104 TaxID=1552121 RepID=UPI0006EC8A29|nr:hypothetical protein [Leptolyngbya sp. NIES-2104]GAP99733.1 hypothetical protein NIES2104_62990 [Leptolyngbya sp. NIES-2104]
MTISSTLLSELLTDPPRPLIHAQAEIIFADDQLFYHHRGQKGEHHYKVISPASVKLAFDRQEDDSGWLPANTVRLGKNGDKQWIIQVHPPQRYTLTLITNPHFHPIDQERVTLTLPLPGFIVLAIDAQVFMWAIKQAFEPAIALFQPPLPNVSSSGLLCFGQNEKPLASSQTIDHIWQTWWEGLFNSHQTNGKSKRFEQDIRWQLWKVANSKKRSYPLSDLRPCSWKTCEEACRAILNPSPYNSW